MLVDDFYKIADLTSRDGFISAEIHLNPEHRLYQGHFPEQAVVPGVMQIQMVKELVEAAQETNLMIKEVSVAKYLRIITPVENKELFIQIDYNYNDTGAYLVNAVISRGAITFSKVKAKLSESTL